MISSFAFMNDKLASAMFNAYSARRFLSYVLPQHFHTLAAVLTDLTYCIDQSTGDDASMRTDVMSSIFIFFDKFESF